MTSSANYEAGMNAEITCKFTIQDPAIARIQLAVSEIGIELVLARWRAGNTPIAAWRCFIAT